MLIAQIVGNHFAIKVKINFKQPFYYRLMCSKMKFNQLLRIKFIDNTINIA